ncbi:MAG: CusA/CzcA family heavy metal efflux RND transporter [Bacteroidota bacterium]
MLNKIIAFSIKNKLIIGLFTIALIIYGSYQFTLLPIDAVPDITNNQVQVITVSPALGAPDVERLITFPIEQANSNIPGLKEIRSFSRFGLSLITIVFNDDVDIYWARQQVTERLKQAEEQIPKGLGNPTLAPVTTGLGEIYQYVLRPEKGYEAKYSATELRTIQDWIVRRQLLGVKGVADVSSFGGLVKQYEIAIRPATLKSNNITINDVFNAIEKNNENTGGAYIEKSSTVLFIRTEGLIQKMDDIKSIVVKSLPNGTPLLLKDIAEVKIGNATRYGAITYNNEGEVAGAVVMMLKGENSSKVISDVKERIEKIKTTLPKGVILEPFLDRTKMVNSAISTVTKNLLEGALIVIFILVLFLGNVRAGFLVASVIPLAMLFAIIMMNMFGVSGNLMSLGALDFGLIVDGAVIIVEAVMHSLTHNKRFANVVSQEEMDDQVNKSAGRMMNSAVFGQIIILIVYLPIFTLEGIEGKMFMPMAQTVAFALLGAFVLSLTYIPMMSTVFLSKKFSQDKNWSDRMMDKLIAIQQRYLNKVLQFPKTTLMISIALLLFSLFVFSGLGGEFIPQLPEGDFAVETRVLTGSNIRTSSEACMKSAEILLDKFPEVEKIVGKTGSGEIPTDPMPMEASDMMIILKDKSKWKSANTWEELSKKMSNALEVIPGVMYSFQYPVAMRFNELMTGAKQDVVCKIFGENLDSLSKYSRILGDKISGINGAENIYVEPIDGLPQLIINYNRNAIAEYGLSIQEVNKVVNVSLAGQSCGQIYEDEKHFDLVVRLDHEERKNVEDVRNLLIPTPNGSQVPLYQVADVTIKQSVNQIQRDDAKRRILVGFNVRGRDVETVVKEVQKIASTIALPTGYYITYGGAFENLQAARDRLKLAVPISLLLIFIFLYFAFQSIKHGLIIYSAIPLSAIGGILFLALRGMPFSISAGVGFIALFGVAVLNGIVLIAEFNRLKNDYPNDLKQVVLHGTKHRLRPVLMTAFVASLGFLPMALSHGAGAEVQRPLATVVIGGLLIATLLTLFVLPVLYLLFENMQMKKMKANTVNNLIIVIGLLLISSKDVRGQNEINLKSAIDSAQQNNHEVKLAELQSRYQNKLIRASIDIANTEFSGQYGQFNSSYNDRSFAISQTIKFPTVYAKQKLVQKENYKESRANINLKETQLKKEISNAYFQLVYLHKQEHLLKEADSLFLMATVKAKLRYESGETDKMHLNDVELQRGQIAMQLNDLTNEQILLLNKFNLLLNTKQYYIPNYNDSLNTIDFAEVNTGIDNHPQLHLFQQQIEIAQSKIKLEKNNLLPELRLGYNSTSIKGTGADNLFYDGSTSFNSLQFGIGLPLFNTAQQAKIKAAKIQELIYQDRYDYEKQVLRKDLENAINNYKAVYQKVSYYENTALKDNASMIDIANKKFSLGEINYLEWALLIQHSITLRSNYTDAVYQLNVCINELNYLTSK